MEKKGIDNSMKFKMAGMVAAVVVVVGTLVIAGQSSGGQLLTGTFASKENEATKVLMEQGRYKLVTVDDYQKIIDDLKQYSTETNKTKRDQLIADAVKILSVYKSSPAQ